MAKGYLFDTVACIRWRRGDPVLQSKVQVLSPDATLYTSVINVGELVLGINKAHTKHKEKLRRRMEEILTCFKGILEVTHEVAIRYGDIVSQVLPGQHIGQNDYWVAAIALTNDLVLVTNDPDFERVPGLQKENWLEQ